MRPIAHSAPTVPACPTHLQILVVALLAASVVPTPAGAVDARAMGLGGSAIAKGHGTHGVLDNPATLMRQQRDGETAQIHAGFGADIRDRGAIIDTLMDDDNQDLADDIESEVDALSGAPVQCIPGAPGNTVDTVCLSGTAGLGNLAGDALDLLDTIDGEQVQAQLTGTLGVGVTSNPVPFAVHLRVVGTAAGRPTVAEGDRTYIGGLQDVLTDDVITDGDIENSPSLSVNTADPAAPTLDIVRPEDALESDVEGSAMQRVQLGVSLARTVTIGKHAVDVGLTPKVSRLRAGNVDTSIADQFDADAASIGDQLENNETSETSLTVDVGAAMDIPETNVRIAGMLKNLVPESIETGDGFEFETTPQLILGTAYTLGQLSFSADLALNSAEVDNLETQPLALGIEYGTRLFQIRGGIAHDAGRDDDATALSLGFGVGPLQIGARVSDLDSAQASAQLSFSF